jgi:hypothetical protein
VNHARAVFLLFFLNLVDTVVTIFWVGTGSAPEANHLMAALLDWGVLPFIIAKVGMGAFTAVVLLYGSEYKLAKIGVTIALVTYAGVMASHILTGLAVYQHLG